MPEENGRLLIRPVSRKEKIKAEISLRTIKGNPDTICEHIREIFRTAENEIGNRNARAKIIEECKIILAYAKRMNAKLMEHKQADDEL